MCLLYNRGVTLLAFKSIKQNNLAVGIFLVFDISNKSKDL